MKLRLYPLLPWLSVLPLSELLLCPTSAAVRNLRREGITRGVRLVGDVMMDAVLQNLRRAERSGLETPAPGSFYLATLHRQENTDDPGRLEELLAGLGGLTLPILFPVHPRTRAALSVCRRTTSPTTASSTPSTRIAASPARSMSASSAEPSSGRKAP